VKTIAICSQKGGSGKTTLAALLAVEAERSGDGPAWLIDTDQQATLGTWHSKREAETPLLAQVPFAGLAAGLRNIGLRGGAFCFIDTAPSLTDQTRAVIRVADLVLIPVCPSPADIWSAAETVSAVKAARKRFLFVITRAKVQASITAQTVAALSRHGHAAQAFVVDRVAYAAALTGGSTAPELSPKGAYG
jgi:chromosome partitioning protein